MDATHTTCMCCYKRFPKDDTNCPRCGLTNFVVIGGEEERDAQRKAMEPFVDGHRRKFLKKYELSVTCHYWKDENGTVVPDNTKRMSFGAADTLLDKTVWLDQEFARLPEEEVDVELTVSETGAAERTIRVHVVPSKEAELWRLGVDLSKDLKVAAHINGACSEVPTALLAD